MSYVILVGSQKSEIGKTVLSIKMGIELSQKGKRVLLADFSGGKRKMSEYFKVDEDIIYDIKDVLDKTCSLEQAAIEIVENLCLVPNPRVQGKLNGVRKQDFKNFIKDTESQHDYDFIIADVGSMSSSFIDFESADHGVIINNNDFSCVREMNADKTMARMNGLNDITLVINRFNKKNAVKGTMLKLRDIQRMTDTKTLYVIEENPKYSQMDSYFLFSSDENSFTGTVKSMVSSLQQ
ncbi:MAG: AAA family ATPase [Sedimentibacter sp.]|uniref:nucleotide-binding protein n=1 Tax=Sedimentibacter sp. TaxID=1960295 RepID=UPI00315924DD